MWYIGQHTVYSIRNVQKKCSLYTAQYGGLAGSHPHADSGKKMGFLAPAYPRPPFATNACGGADNGNAPPAVATSFEPYLNS